MLKITVKVWGSAEEEKERLQWEGVAEKKGLSLEWKREWVMKN